VTRVTPWAFVERLRGLTEEGIAAGESTGVDPLLAATALDAVTSRVRDPHLLREHGPTASEAFDPVPERVRHGLERPPPPETGAGSLAERGQSLPTPAKTGSTPVEDLFLRGPALGGADSSNCRF